MSEELFTSLINDGVKLLHIPVVNCLSTAFGKKSRRVKRQALIEFKIGEQLYELTVIVAPELVTDIILGSDLMNEYAVNLYYSEGTFEMKLEGVYYQYNFQGALTEQLSRAEVTGPRGKSLERGEFRTPKANVDLECGVDSRQLGAIKYDEEGRCRDLETALMKEYID
jgi:hypothetical protein